MKRAECVKCGYCCTIRPCSFGIWDYEKKRCIYLTKENLCSEYEKIKKIEGSKYSPAFGEGCSSSLFNEVRERKIIKGRIS